MIRGYQIHGHSVFAFISLFLRLFSSCRMETRMKIFGLLKVKYVCNLDSWGVGKRKSDRENNVRRSRRRKKVKRRKMNKFIH